MRNRNTSVPLTRREAVLSISSLFTSCLTAPAAGETPSMNAIEKAWKDRAGRATTARFKFKRESVLHPMLLSGEGLLDPADFKPVSIKFSAAIDLKGEKLRYDYTGEQWSLQQRALRAVRYAGAYDGEMRSALYEYPGANLRPDGRLYKGRAAEVTDANSLSVSAIFVNLRPLSKHSGDWRLDGYRPTDKVVKVDGTACHELARYSPEADRYLYLDAVTDWNVRRVQTVRRGQTTLDYTIDYTKAPTLGWRVSKWNFVMKDSLGNLLETEKGTVTDARINQEIDDALFRITFPPGTEVYGPTKGE